MVTKAGIKPPNLRGASPRGIESSANPLEGRLSHSGTSDLRLDSLIFDTEKFSLGKEDSYVAGPPEARSPESKAVHGQAAPEPPARVSRWAYLIRASAWLKIAFSGRRIEIWTAATLMLCVAVAGVVLHIAWSDGYRVETKLLLFDRDKNPNNSASKTLEEEVEILKSPQILHLLSREMYERQPEGPAGGEHLRTVPRTTTEALSRFGSQEALEKWLVNSTRVSSEVSGGTARVALRLSGDEPDFLTSLLDAYVCRYVDYRRNLEAESMNPSRQAGLQEQEPATIIPAEVISTQLQKIGLQEQGSKLALHLIDSGKGVFSGFVPDQSLTGVPSLTHFQDKIIQLEIKKRALATQYMPGSREITVVDLEIQGVRSAMRECLAEHLQFLKKEKEQLLAQKNGSYPCGSPLVGHDQAPSKGCWSRQSPGQTDSWLVPREGLYVLRETPVIAQRPLLARTGNFANKLIAYLAPSPAATVVSEYNQKRDSSRPQGLSVDGRTYDSGGQSQGGSKQQSLQPTLTTPPVWQRAATSHSNAPQQHTGPSNLRPRQ